MKIYTKTGDHGQTGLYGGGRVSKANLRIAAYGETDELNSLVGLARAKALRADQPALESIQNDLFNVGAELATPPKNRKALAASELLAEDRVRWLESEIDRMEASLEPLKTFVLPGGSEASAILHLARTVCRRAERAVVALGKKEKIRPLMIEYLNRLSDYFFVLARFANQQSGVGDVPWTKPVAKLPK